MSEPSSDRSQAVDQAFSRISSVDLTPVRKRLQRHGWPASQVVSTEAEYLRMLALMGSHPAQPLAPSPLIDEFWHAHILHTRLYAEHCQYAFGYFVHHTPSEGAVESARQETMTALEQTLRLYREYFEDPNPQVWDVRGETPEKPKEDDPEVADCTTDPNWCTGNKPGEAPGPDQPETTPPPQKDPANLVHLS